MDIVNNESSVPKRKLSHGKKILFLVMFILCSLIFLESGIRVYALAKFGNVQAWNLDDYIYREDLDLPFALKAHLDFNTFGVYRIQTNSYVYIVFFDLP